MYASFFGLKREPFSIAPDPRYLFMSERHREALAHLLYGVGGGGGFVLLTGEIGAGKTTVCRCFLEQIPKRCNVAYIFNPKLNAIELLQTVCDEFRIPTVHEGPGEPTVKDYVDPLNEFLLRTHAVGQNNVLIIDEAQNLSPEVLEQLRLLTNLETSERKLLQIILIGQPELRAMLARPELEQLAQRVIARYHLDALSEAETAQYIRHRLNVAGGGKGKLFDAAALRRVHQLARGIPRRINLLCDRSLLGAYAGGRNRVDRTIVDKAAAEVFDLGRGAGGPLSSFGPAAASGAGWSPADGGLRALPAWAWGALVGVLIFAVVGLLAAFMQPPPKASTSVARAAAPDAAPRPSAGSQPQRVDVAPTASPATASNPALAAPPATTHTPGPTPAPTPAPTVPPAVADLDALTLTDERSAWRELGAVWGLPLGNGAPCGEAARQRVMCFIATAGLDQIRQLDRPAVLTLSDDRGRPAYAVLVGLSRNTAVLQHDGLRQPVPLDRLARRWRGEFATLWRMPPGYTGKLLAGHSGPAVDWLGERFARIDGQPAPPPGRTVDAALQARIAAFQLAQGIQPDGVAGAVTLMQINRATGVDEPRLQTPERAAIGAGGRAKGS